jgi:AhpD family alkylhydroperoxidase
MVAFIAERSIVRSFDERRTTNDEERRRLMSAIATQANIASDPKVSELIALASAVGSNCEACFRSHYETARRVGLSTEEIVQALSTAEAVKATPARRMRELAARKLDMPVEALSSQSATPAAEGELDDPAGDCGCSPGTEAQPPQAEAECC